MVWYKDYFLIFFYIILYREVCMKKIFKFFVIFVCFFSLSFSCFAFEIDSDKAILINLKDNSVIYSKNSDEKAYVASLTKMMTAIVVLENVDNLDDKVYITDEDWKGLIENDASVANFARYRKYSYLDLLYGLMLPSGADSANALSRLVGGDLDNFVKMMNDKAKEIGLNNTHFANCTGLDDDENYSTASDMAKLLNYGIKNETFKKIITTMKYTAYDGTVLRHTIDKYSKLNNITIKGLLGGKTGNTELAGVCLASIAEYNGVSYLLVVLNAKYPYQLIDTKTIYEYYMNNYGYKTLINKGDALVSLNTLYTKDKSVDIVSLDDYSYYLNNDYDESLLSFKYTGEYVVSYNNKKGDFLGVLSVYYDDDLVDTLDIYLDRDMSFSLISFISYNIIYFVILIILVISFIIIFFIVRHKRKIRKEIIIKCDEIL